MLLNLSRLLRRLSSTLVTTSNREWLWPNFTREELSCPRTGEYYHDPEFLTKLEYMRALYGGEPFRINSAHRSPEHNARVGGAAFSQHKKMAADISLRGKDPLKMYRAAIEAGFRGIGLARTFIHVDLRRPIGNYTPPSGGLVVWYYSKQGENLWKNLLEAQPEADS